MRLEHLKYIVEIYHCQSINKAAEKLYLSQSTLSSALRNLEKELGFSIFHRSIQGTYPTENGWRIIHEAEQILTIINGWTNVQSETEKIEGDVHINILPSIAKVVLADVTINIQSSFPEINIIPHESYNNINRLNSAEMLDKALKKKNNTILIGTVHENDKSFLTALEDNYPNINSYFIYADEIVLMISSNHPYASKKSISLSELKDLPICFYPDCGKQFIYPDILPYFQDINKYSFSLHEKVLSLVSSNKISLLVSKKLIQDTMFFHNDTVTEVKIKDFIMPTYYYIVYPDAAEMTKAQKIVVEAFIEVFNKIQIECTCNNGHN